MEAPAQAHEPQGDASASPDAGNKELVTFYRCNRCGKALFSERRLEKHQVRPKYRFRDKASGITRGSMDKCTSFFLEDIMPWMPTAKEPTGTIYCPSCKHKLGSYTLFGDTCSCGTFVEPAIRIHKKCVSSFEAYV